jgi:hypothetical protein
VNRSTLSHVSVTCSRPPEVSSTAFHAQPPDLPPVPLMDVGFAIIGPLARHRRPQMQFLSIGSRVCSTLLADPASRRCPCASLILHLHQAWIGDFHPRSCRPCSAHQEKAVSNLHPKTIKTPAKLLPLNRRSRSDRHTFSAHFLLLRDLISCPSGPSISPSPPRKSPGSFPPCALLLWRLYCGL